MKTNAIVRIVLWSLVIILLVAILGSVLLGRSAFHSLSRIFRDEDSYAETFTPARLDENGVPIETAVPVAPLNPDETVRLPAEEIRDIAIEWAAGKILIQPIDTDEVQFFESDVTDIKNALVWKQRGSKLSIAFCDESVGNFLNFGGSSNLTKDLTIYVPNNWTLDSLEIDAASATLEVNDLRISEVEIDTASGACKFDNCTVRELDLDTASGDIRFYGFLDILDCDAASASVYAVLTNVPTRMDLDSMSGDLDITLPDGAGFTASVEGLSTDFSTDFETTNRNGSYVCGDGRCRISVDAMSGDVIIRKAAETVSETIIPTEVTDAVSTHHEHTESCTIDPDSCPDNHIHHDYSGDDSPTGAQSTSETTATHHPEEHHN